MAKSIRTITVLLAATTVAFLIVGVTLGIANSQPSDGNYDTDGDGLIEISYLEQLNASATTSTATGDRTNLKTPKPTPLRFPTPSLAGSQHCNGYELTRLLDFDDAGSYASRAVNITWTTGSGWLPIGVEENRFETMFDGNRQTISNLYIERLTALDDGVGVGLFGYTADLGVVHGIGLVDVDVVGLGLVGGLVGSNKGTISGKLHHRERGGRLGGRRAGWP